MGDSPTTDWTNKIVTQAGSSTAHLAECQKMALQHQQELMQDAQQRMTNWTKRRQQALETGLDALSRMAASKNPIEIAAICSEWMTGSMTRMMADFEEAQAHSVKLAEHMQTASKTMLSAGLDAGLNSGLDTVRTTAAAAAEASRHLPVVQPEPLRQAAE